MSALPETDSPQADNALSLVQAQHAVSQVILGTSDPVDIVRAFHRFTGNQFSRAELALPTDTGTFRIVAAGAPAAVRPADRSASLNDYPGMATDDSFASIYIRDVRDDQSLTEAEQNRLTVRSIRSLLLEPLVAAGQLVGVLAFMHTDPVDLNAATRRALHLLANQLASTLHHQRLLESAQAAATQEHTLNALFTRFEANTSVDELLGMALTELGQMLGAERGAIRLGQPEPVTLADERPTHD